MIAQGATKYTAELHWRTPEGEHRVERHTGLEVRTPTTKAYRRAVSLLAAGQAVSFTTRHFERKHA